MKINRSFSMFLMLILVIVPLLTACGPQKVTVNLTNYKIDLSASSVSSGDITFHITNGATDIKHEFLIFKTDLAIDKLPTTAEGRIDEESKIVTLVLDSGELDPGVSVDKSLKLAPGNYVVVCNMMINNVAHYPAGMREAFTVK